MAEWIGFGQPLKLINVGNIAWVELREYDATVHLMGGGQVPVPNFAMADLVISLQKVGATALASSTEEGIDPDHPA